jgi:U3 small nucleolar ribonucleoprotein component
MASGGKKRTTMAKLNREQKLRERRLDKQARKDARKQAASERGPEEDVVGELPLPDAD